MCDESVNLVTQIAWAKKQGRDDGWHPPHHHH